jgi:gamma-glutamyltranspeptidase/glutathione hydrolase/leukotriene-C4 hydrolase
MEEKEEWADVFRPRGAMLVEGDWLRRTNYSKTLEYIAQNGIDSFYGHGEDPWIAQAMVDAVGKEGGVLSMDDLRGYAVEVYDPIKSTYHGNTIYTTDAPSCGKQLVWTWVLWLMSALGPVMLGMLNVLEHYNLSTSDNKLTNKTRTALNQHRVIEAMKYGFAARTEIGDIHHSGDNAQSRRERIDYFSTKAWAEEVYRNMTDVGPHDFASRCFADRVTIGHDAHGIPLQSRL